MWNKNNTGIIYSDHISKKFNLNEYKKKVLSFSDNISEDETWIRSGNFIPAIG